MTPKVWQIGTGDAARDYSSVFVEHDIMFLGPGDPGPWDESTYAKAVERGVLSGHKAGGLRQFCDGMQGGQIVLLRTKYRVRSIGLVGPEPYKHDVQFDDVAGWDLQHTRRVIWQGQLDQELAAIQRDGELFASRKQIPTFTGVNDTTVLDPIRSLFGRCAERELRPMPTVPSPLALDKVGQLLFQRGLANAAVEQVLTAIGRARRLTSWYYEHGEQSGRPLEHEVVAYLVLPLLQALGWSEQLVGIEWNKADLVGFRATPTTADQAVLLCEAKHLGHGLQGVLDQAERYVRKNDLLQCRRILITDGLRFYVHRHGDSDWEREPVGYVNLAKIREEHLLPRGTSGVDTLMSLTPARIFRAS